MTISNSTLANHVDLCMDTMWTSGGRADWIGTRTVVVNNVKFDTSHIQSFDGVAPQAIWMNYTYTPGNDGVANLAALDELLVYNYNQVQGDNFRVYYNEQAANYIIPQSVTYAPLPGAQIVASPVAGLTNSQAWSTYGVAIAGAVASSSSTRRNFIKGLVNPI